VVVDEPTDPGKPPQHEAAGLTGVISPEGLTAARELANQARAILKETEDLGAALDTDLPLIANVKARQATARADLRRAYFALQDPRQSE
jgi:hypothetical protein